MTYPRGKLRTVLFGACLLAALVGAMVTAPSLATLLGVQELFARGDYAGAGESLRAGEEGARLGEDILWRSRLAQQPEQAVDLLQASLNDSRLPLPTRQRMALELAEIHFARGDYRDCLTVLKGIIAEAEEGLPGEAYLLAGMTQRLVGNIQGAREMLASVRPADPAFPRARYYLGSIGLQQGDHALALRYFESGMQNLPAEAQPELQAGRWQALRMAGRSDEAGGVRDLLSRENPGSLALLEINRILREEADELAQTALDQVPRDTVITQQPTSAAGRFSLQVGAFSDRALALDYLNRHRAELPDLRVDQVQDDRGQYLYKVRSGYYMNPALARSEAARLRRELGIDVIVTDGISSQFGRD